VTRRSRTEITVPSLQQSFEFDFVLEPTSGGGCDELWAEAKPVLDSALRSPASYACVFLAASPAVGIQGHRPLVSRLVEQLFECVADVTKSGESTLDATMTMVEMGPDNSGFYNLLQEGPMDRCVAPKLVEDVSEGNLAVHELSTLSLRTREEVLAAQNAGATRRSKWYGHSVLSICVQRHDTINRELVCVARLVIVEIGSLLEGFSGPSIVVPAAFEHGPSPTARSGSRRQLEAVTRAAQACIDRTCEVCGSGRQGTVVTAPTQAKILIIASVSPHQRHLQETLPILQLAAASAALQERSTSKPDDARRQLAKLLSENQRLRHELVDRCRVPSQVENGTTEHSEEAAMTSPAAVGASTPGPRSPRERERDNRRTAVAVASAASPAVQRCWGQHCPPKESRMTPENRRRACGASCLLPSR